MSSLLLFAFVLNGELLATAADLATVQKELQKKLDDAAPGSIVNFGHVELVTIDAPLQITKPLWVRGLRLQLPPKLPRTSLVEVTVPGVRITDSHFRGNGDTVGQDQRASLVNFRAGELLVERCIFENSSKNGLTIDPGDTGKPLIGGVIRDIVGRNVTRDVVSLSGGPHGAYVQDVLVENVRAYESELRGAVEVSDGSRNITVRSITAEDCVYAVDFQDHDDPSDINHNVLIEDVRARDCRHAVRTATDLPGHTGLTIRDVYAENCDVPVRVSEIRDVLIDGVRIVGRERDPSDDEEDLQCLLQVKNCANVSIRDVSIFDGGELPTAVRVIDSEQLSVDGLSVAGDTSFDHALVCQFSRSDKLPPIDKSLFRRISAPTARGVAVTLSVDLSESKNIAATENSPNSTN
jgi:hypothetical protein